MNRKSASRCSNASTLLVVLAAMSLVGGACTSSNFTFSSGTSSIPTTGSTSINEAPSTTFLPAPTAAPATPPPASGDVPTSSPCHIRTEYGYVLPDPICTPGAINPEVTAANIGQTICAYGWTRTVRPPESYTEALKRSQMGEYGDTRPIYDYEEDHLIPLELGGAPSDPHNLWPDPGASPNMKDDVENAANRAVCDGRMGLAAAQRQIATDWVAFGRSLGVITGPGEQSP